MDWFLITITLICGCGIGFMWGFIYGFYRCKKEIKRRFKLKW